MRCEVLRPFQATNDEQLMPGTPDAPCIVDTTGWREVNIARLIERRYLRIVPDIVMHGPLEEPVSDGESLSTVMSAEKGVSKSFVHMRKPQR